MPLVPFRQLSMGLVNGAQSLGQGLVNGAANAINRAGEVAYDASQSSAGQKIGQFEHRVIDPALTKLGLIKPDTPPRDIYAEKGYPAYMTNANANTFNRTFYQSQLGNYDPKTLPKAFPEINAYRADPTNKYGGDDGLETLPTRFTDSAEHPILTAGTPQHLYSYVRAYGQAAKHYDIPKMSAQQLAALAIKEGRSDFGASTFDIDNPHSKAMYEELKSRGLGDLAAQFPVIVAEKAAVAKRLNIPFAEAWNGTGSNGNTTGAQYAKGYEHTLKAAAHPKNKPLVDFIQSALDAGARDR